MQSFDDEVLLEDYCGLKLAHLVKNSR
jgi:hypothetical protein